MSRADLPPEVQASWDGIRREWHLVVPLQACEDRMHRDGYRFAGPPATQADMESGGRTMAKALATVLAKPGPLQRAVRGQVKANNRRRWGPR